MRAFLLDYLVCPCCQQGCTLITTTEHADGWIEEGTLRCVPCQRNYPICRGVPRFPSAERSDIVNATKRTKRTYNFTWGRFGAREVAQEWEKDSYDYGRVIPPALFGGAGQVGLDAGCGGGADLLRLALKGSAKVIGVDLSDGVDAAAQLTRHLPHVSVVQADIHQLPFRPDTFDFAYSFGVLHHLPQPLHGFERLAVLLKPGAPLITYLYEDFSDRSRLERGILGFIHLVRTVTSRLPAPLLYVLCWVLVPLVWLCCSVPARLLRSSFPKLAERMPFRHTMRWPVLASDLLDRFAPPLEWRYSRDAVLRLYHHASFDRVEVHRYRGWVSWGSKKETRTDGRHASPDALVGSMRRDA